MLKQHNVLPDKLKKFKKISKMNALAFHKEANAIIILKNLVELYFDNIMPKKYLDSLKKIPSKLIDEFMKIYDKTFIFQLLNLPSTKDQSVNGENFQSFLNLGTNEQDLDKYSFSSETSNASSILPHNPDSVMKFNSYIKHLDSVDFKQSPS